MNHKIYPCLWFDQNASEAANYYCRIFPESSVLHRNEWAYTLQLNGTQFMLLNGGPKYRVNSAVSYFIHCGSEAEILRYYDEFSSQGQILMPLDQYSWSPKYAWVMDRFGVHWQLDIEDIRSSQKLVPCLLFTHEKMNEVKNAVHFYTSIFGQSKVLMQAPWPPEANMPTDSLVFAQFKIGDIIMNAMSSNLNHDFDFTPGNSMVVECKDQMEIDHYWDQLGDGGRYDMCGWLTDRYGLSWQIVPAILPELMSDPMKGPRVVERFLKMQKFDLQALLDA
ncbi:MAG: VOC family protein [Saprospiraceae bacterium]|nr:VOC family protein [Saprospiraceae bacterium]